MNKRKLRQKLADIIDSPPAALSGSFIELCSNTQATVEGCRNILEYDESNIKLKCCDICVSFKGDGLYIRLMNDSSAIICGTIASIDFSED